MEINDESSACKKDQNGTLLNECDEEKGHYEYTDITWRDIKPQVIASHISFLMTIHAGINLCYTNLLLNLVDRRTSTWFASIIGLSSPIGSIICGPLLDKLGRRKTQLISAVPCLISWILLYIADIQQTELLYFSRFLGGLSSGLTTAALIYVSEIANKKYRPSLLGLLSVYFSIGILLTSFLNVVFTWNQIAGCFFIMFTFITLLISYYIPESPVWLAKFKGDYDGAKQALATLNPNKMIFDEEWHSLKNVTQLKTTSNKRIFKFSDPVVYKAILTLMALFTLQQLSGVYVIISYTVKMFGSLRYSINKGTEDISFIIFSIIRLLTSIVSSYLGVRFGRKSLLYLSIVGMLCCSVPLVIVTTFISDSGMLTVARYWLATVLLIGFVGFGGIGLMNVPWCLSAELLPHDWRGLGSTGMVTFGYVLMFFTMKVYLYVLEWTGVGLLFAGHSAILLLGIIFVKKFIPETLGKTLDEIQSHFKA